MRILTNIEQWTPEWINARRWVITGTRLKSVMSKKWTKARNSMIDELIAEEMSPDEWRYVSDAMINWTILEPQAREEFERITGKKVETVWFCLDDKKNCIWYSPDWLIKVRWKYKEWIEIKCPWAKNHIRYILDNKIPDEYLWQVVHAFIVNNDLQRLYFISHNPHMYIEKLRTHIIPVTREDLLDEIGRAQSAIDDFVGDRKKAVLSLV